MSNRSRVPLLLLAGVLLWLATRVALTPAPPAVSPLPKPAPVARPEPARPCPSWPQQEGRRSSAIIEGGRVGPDNRQVMVDFPSEFWKANVTSRGQGCCGFRSLDFAAHWQNVPALFDFPEWLQKTGRPGGAYPGNVDQRIPAICKDRGLPVPQYIQSESKDLSLLKLIIATGRLPITDYSGRDGVHYHTPIAHCICTCYVDDEYVCILDNNFPPDKLLWMPTADYQARWGGWIIALLAPRPPAPPHN